MLAFYFNNLDTFLPNLRHLFGSSRDHVTIFFLRLNLNVVSPKTKHTFYIFPLFWYYCKMTFRLSVSHASRRYIVFGTKPTTQTQTQTKQKYSPSGRISVRISYQLHISTNISWWCKIAAVHRSTCFVEFLGSSYVICMWLEKYLPDFKQWMELRFI